MDTSRKKSEVTVSRSCWRAMVPMGLFVSRLLGVYLVCSAPAPAHVRLPGTGCVSGLGPAVVAESLDPKHEKDHDEGRDRDTGRGSRGRSLTA